MKTIVIKAILMAAVMAVLIGLLSGCSLKKIIVDPNMLDGPGMVYEGGPLDEAISGCWASTDERYVLDFDGKFADFYVDGNKLFSKDEGYFVEHNFTAADDLNERCDLSLFAGPDIKGENYETILTIDEMWYQSEHIYMQITWPDGKSEALAFNGQKAE